MSARRLHSTLDRMVRGTAFALFLFGGIWSIGLLEKDPVEAVVLPRAWDCALERSDLAAEIPPAQCDTLVAAADTEHVRTAPRYESRNLCEETHGANACTAAPASDTGTTAFLPILAGYMVGSADPDQRAHVARPLIPTRSGGVTTTDGTIRFQDMSGRFQVPPRILTATPPPTIGTPPKTRAKAPPRRAPTGVRGLRW